MTLWALRLNLKTRLLSKEKSLFPGNSYPGNTLVARSISNSSMRHFLYEYACIDSIYGCLTVTNRVEGFGLLGCEAVLLGRWFPMFRRNIRNHFPSNAV
jgi:hypothetical protein